MVQIDTYEELSYSSGGQSLTVSLANSELYGNSATNGSGLYLDVQSIVPIGFEIHSSKMCPSSSSSNSVARLR